MEDDPSEILMKIKTLQHWDLSYNKIKRADLDEESEEYKNKMSMFAYNQGEAEYSVKHYEESLKLFNESLSYNPNKTEAIYGKALVYYSMKEYDTSIQLLTDYLGLIPDDNGALHRRGVCYNKLAQYINGLNDFNKILERIPFIPAY